ncbi:MAG: sel1 repeat family protein [Succinivibrionaceae bacterium]|nr:sel1 repeat family protein [Succinivibrionaceae bacterium]
MTRLFPFKTAAVALLALAASGCSVFGLFGDAPADGASQNPSVDTGSPDVPAQTAERVPGQCYAAFLEENYQKAFELCSGSREPEALYNTAWMYGHGRGASQNLAKSRVLMERAALGGHAGAMYETGRMYDSGLGGRQSYRDAILWYQKAAEKREIRAMNALASMYYCGDGTEQDFGRSLLWSLRAADAGSGEGMYNVGRLLEEKKILPGQVAEPDADLWYKRAAEKRYPEAEFLLARRDYQKTRSAASVRRLKQAAADGSPGAAMYLGTLAEKALAGVKKSRSKAAAYCWYSLAAAGGSSEAGEKMKHLASGFSASQLKSVEDNCHIGD